MEPTAEPTHAPAPTPDPTQAPVTPDKPEVERGTTSAQPEVAPDVDDVPTTVIFEITPLPFDAFISITITATVSPISSRGTIEFAYDGTTTSGLALDGAGQAALTTTAAEGLKVIDVDYSGCIGFLPSSNSGLTDTRVIPEMQAGKGRPQHG